MRSPAVLLFCLLTSALAQQVYNLTLPWGIWQSEYDSQYKVYKFLNVRFGAPPTGSRRFQAAAYPDERNSNIQKGSDASCIQTRDSEPNQSEDCLFLDIYVPEGVMHSVRDKQLPSASVVVWIYGGAFLYGSKSQAMHDGFHTPLYDGRGVLSHAQHDTVFVTGNYRIGAFGWLAGTTMEEGGLPNAGLSDQRLLFDWVQRYIAQVGGDKTSVSAWGESAGASSILHHLVSRDGNGQQLQPQFTRAALQSPAYQWMWDRDGQLEETYYNFTCYVCALVEGQTCCRDPKMPQTETFSYKPKYNVSQLSQLGDKNVDWLIKANQLLFQNTVSCTGIFPVGPSVDGKFIERLAITELAKGRFAPLDSILVSHVEDEAKSFINPPYAHNDSEYRYVLSEVFPGDKLAGVRQAIAHRYSDSDQTLRLKKTIQDVAFLSNNRALIDAYSSTNTTVWAMNWDALKIPLLPDFSIHATDLLPLFYLPEWDLYGFLKAFLGDNFPIDPDAFKLFLSYFTETIVPSYGTYFTNQAATGDPNLGGHFRLKRWDPAMPDTTGVKHTMQVNGLFQRPFTSVLDKKLTADMGKFWLAQGTAIMETMGGS